VLHNILLVPASGKPFLFKKITFTPKMSKHWIKCAEKYQHQYYYVDICLLYVYDFPVFFVV